MEHLYKPMWRKPPPSSDDASISITVIVYELEMDTKEIVDVDFGYFNYEDGEWHVLGDMSMVLMCWTEIPNPTIFMENRDWEPVTHSGFN